MDDATSSRRRRLELLRHKRARFEKGESSSAYAELRPVNYSRQNEVPSIEPFNVSALDNRCNHCGAYFWYRERCKRLSRANSPKYNFCCREGKVLLPPLTDPPLLLDSLLGPESSHFREKIRMYNSMFAFTSMGVKVDESVNVGQGPYVFKVSGQACHRIGSLLPFDGSKPMFAQLYVYDTANEVVNRINAFKDSYTLHNKPHQEIVQKLIDMFNECNVIVQGFRNLHERFINCEIPDLKLRIVGVRDNESSQYAPPIASEIVGLVVGDLTEEQRQRDIIEHRTNGLQRIKLEHPCYMPMQYLLLFPYGEDGFHSHIRYVVDQNSQNRINRKCVTMNEYYYYRLHQRDGDALTLFRSGRLFQQYVVDAYLSIEQRRLSYLQQNQASLRSEKYKNIKNAVLDGDMLGKNIGKRIVLPASHVGSPRYMFQNYQDAIVICKHIGLPDLYITFTYNPQWPEIESVCLQGQRPEDRPDITARIFKMKLEEMVRDIKEKKHFGEAIAR